MFAEILKKLVRKQDLTEKEASEAMKMISKEEASEAQIAAFLTALTIKGETIPEITGMVKVMRTFAVPVKVKGPLLDTCGTGGSGLPRINVSTITAFVLAGGGIRIAKHGNRALGGRCGSFDLLEKLGAKIELGPDQVKKTLQKTGLGFMFAPLYHPLMKNLMPVRRALQIRTVFNFLGPLLNPARVQYQILGVSDLKMAFKIVLVLKNLGLKKALVVTGFDGLDEITLSAPTQILELKNGKIRKFIFEPGKIGLKKVPFSEIKGGTPEENAEIALKILKGKIKDPRTDLVCLNAAAGFYLMNKVKNFKEGFKLAQEILRKGKAQKKLEEYLEISHQV